MKGMIVCMFISSNILEVSDEEIVMINYKSNPFNKKIYKIEEKNCSGDSSISLSNYNGTVVIEGEEVYIKKLTLPNVKEAILEKMISDELKVYYRMEEDICFSYSILSRNKYNMQIALFYINSQKLKKIYLKNVRKIKAVYMLQFCLIGYIKKKIKDISKYMLAFMYNNNLYILFCESDVLTANCVIKNFSGSNLELLERINNFIKINRCSADFQKLYLLGFSKAAIDGITTQYKYEDLGNIHRQDIFKYFV